MKKAIATLIWNVSETLKIPLGKFTPIVLGWMTAGNVKNIKYDLKEFKKNPRYTIINW